MKIIEKIIGFFTKERTVSIRPKPSFRDTAEDRIRRAKDNAVDAVETETVGFGRRFIRSVGYAVLILGAVIVLLPGIGATWYGVAGDSDFNHVAPRWATGNSKTENTLYNAARGAHYHAEKANEAFADGEWKEGLDHVGAYFKMEKEPSAAQKVGGFLKFWD